VSEINTIADAIVTRINGAGVLPTGTTATREYDGTIQADEIIDKLNVIVVPLGAAPVRMSRVSMSREYTIAVVVRKRALTKTEADAVTDISEAVQGVFDDGSLPNDVGTVLNYQLILPWANEWLRNSKAFNSQITLTVRGAIR